MLFQTYQKLVRILLHLSPTLIHKKSNTSLTKVVNGGDNKRSKQILYLSRNNSKKKSEYTSLDRYGVRKDFKDKQSLLAWLHNKLTDGMYVARKNGVIGYWCTKCARWFSRKTGVCKRDLFCKPPSYTAHIANIYVDSDESEISIASSLSWSDCGDIEVSCPRKKDKNLLRRYHIRKSVWL